MLIKVSDWSKSPGPRLKSEGKHSGEEFRELIYPVIFNSLVNGIEIQIDLDGTYGYSSGFLEEVFGGLIRHNGLYTELFNLFVEIISNEDPDLIKEINQYMKEADEYVSKTQSN